MLESVKQAADRFIQAVAELSADALIAPSGLPGWSRGHVVAHVALNAEAFNGVARQLGGGGTAHMYPGDSDRRSRDIDQLATAAPDELRHRLAASHERFVELWSEELPAGKCATAEGHPTFSSATVPLRRLRELQVHLVDLDLDGHGPDTWLDSYVTADLPLQWLTVEHRTDRAVHVVDDIGERYRAGGLQGAGEPVVVDRRRLLAWVLDRATIAGLPALSPWSNRSTWEHLSDSPSS